MTTTQATRVSRLRVLAMAERERYRHGWSVLGDRAEQRCPCCHHTVRATAPDPPATPDEVDDYTRQINNLLNDAVLDHIHHDCPDPGEVSR
jgi:hypothetical protein